eukprot:6184648-Pleurochrysis_carterae.AAC.4
MIVQIGQPRLAARMGACPEHARVRLALSSPEPTWDVRELTSKLSLAGRKSPQPLCLRAAFLCLFEQPILPRRSCCSDGTRNCTKSGSAMGEGNCSFASAANDAQMPSSCRERNDASHTDVLGPQFGGYEGGVQVGSPCAAALNAAHDRHAAAAAVRCARCYAMLRNCRVVRATAAIVGGAIPLLLRILYRESVYGYLYTVCSSPHRPKYLMYLRQQSALARGASRAAEARTLCDANASSIQLAGSAGAAGPFAYHSEIDQSAHERRARVCALQEVYLTTVSTPAQHHQVTL